MKKQFGLPLMLASVLAFSACSSEDVTDGGKKDINALADGGFVKMNISLPTRSANSSRANDDFYDGILKEYAVNNATLILFQGNDEDGALFHSAYDISKNFVLGTDRDQITSTEKLVKSVKGDLSGTNLYALVVLNKNEVIAPQSDHTLKVNNVDFSGNFAELKKTIVSNNVTSFTNGGFFMTNAPLANVQGGSNNPSSATFQTLVRINNSIFSSQGEAENHPAADIYVERGVAKVTLDQKTGTLADEVYNDVKNADGTSSFVNDKVKYEIDAWGLDNTNNTTYLVHIPNTTWNGYKSDYVTSIPENQYRFIGQKEVQPSDRTGDTPLYRSYWGEDTNYETDAAIVDNFTAEGLYGLKENPDVSDNVDYSKLYTQFGLNNPLYCFENTFDVAHQKQDQTTRVVVRAKLSTGSKTGTFYTVNNVKSTIYYPESLNNLLKKAIMDNAKFKNAIGAKVVPASDITITLSAANESENNKVTLASFSVSTAGVNITPTVMSDVCVDVNDQVRNICEYKGGYAYYPIRIKHFGDDQTPWNSNSPTTNIAADNIYPTTGAGQDANYLGRYGVLRNNWYELSVNSIRTIGSATVPSRPGTPDDELNSYISVTINILSWARRSQSEDL